MYLGFLEGGTVAQFIERGSEDIDHFFLYRHFKAVGSEHAFALVGDDTAFECHAPDRLYGLEVETAFQGATHFIDSFVAGVGGRYHVKAGRGEEQSFFSQFGDVQYPVAHDTDQAVLYFQRTTGDLFEASDNAPFHTDVDGRGDKCFFDRTFCQEERIVPGVFDIVLAGSCRALYRIGTDTADGGRE